MRVRDPLKVCASLTFVVLISGLAVAYGGRRGMIAFLALACAVLLAGYLLFRRRHLLANRLHLSTASSVRERERPDFLTEILFLLLLSGPPMFRARSPLATIRGKIDIVVIFQLLVWGLAGIWVLRPLAGRLLRHGQRVHLQLPQKLGLALVLCLGLSALVSPAPAFTIFKVYEMAVSLLFGFFFVNRYGVEFCLNRLLLAYTILCVGAVVLAFLAPNVLFYGRNHSGIFRLRGDLYVPIGALAVFAIALLFANPPAVPKPIFVMMFGLFSTLLILSETRTAYVAVFVFIALAIVRRPKIAMLRGFLYMIPLAYLTLFLAGLMPDVRQWIVRDPRTITDFGGRLELWTFLWNQTIAKSPLIGLGYASAGRVLSLDFESNLGNAHSAFVGVLVGGGILSISFLMLLVCALVVYALVLFCRNNDRVSFSASSLLPLVLVMASGGWGYFDSGLIALTFWCLAAMLPLLRTQSLKHGAKVNKAWMISRTRWHSQPPVTE